MKAFFGVCLCLAWSFAAVRALAGSETGPHPAVLPDSVDLAVDVGGSGLSPERIRAAVESELRVPVRLSDSTTSSSLAIRITPERRATVAYRRSESETVERAIDLPAEEGRAVETIALLAGNLARDEASELLDALKPPAPPVPPPSPAARVLEKKLPAEPKLPPGALPVHFSLFAPLGYESHGERYRYDLELGLFYGRVGAVDVVGANFLALSIDRAARGVAGAGLLTVVGRDVSGVEFSGITSVAGGRVFGVQAAGIASVAAGFVGVQAAAVTVASAPFDGVQAGVVNVARTVKGVQGGLVNVSSGRVHGVQIGIVNVAEDSDLSLGLVTVLRRGRTHLDVWASDIGAFTAIKTGGTYFHNIYGGGIDPLSSPVRYFATLGLGAHAPVSESLWVDLDGLAHVAFDGMVGRGSEYAEFRLLGGIELAHGVAVFAGPSARFRTATLTDAVAARTGLGGTAGLSLF